MDFPMSAETADYHQRLSTFMLEHIFEAEARYEHLRHEAGPHRAMRIFDVPDEVHMRTIARAEIGREKAAFAAAVI
jgi:hypothetical protein